MYGCTDMLCGAVDIGQRPSVGSSYRECLAASSEASESEGGPSIEAILFDALMLSETVKGLASLPSTDVRILKSAGRTSASAEC